MTLDLNSDLSKMTGARQTMLSWSKVVESFETMPEVFKHPYKMALGDVQPFPYVVFAPSVSGVSRKLYGNGKLVCEANDSIFIWEYVGNQVEMVEYPLNAISDLEIGGILLFSWMTISGTTKAGMASSSTVEFNTATHRYFTRFMNKMRPNPVNVDELEHEVERSKFDYLTTENFKFMNYARESLVRGEKVTKILSQPKISKPLISFGKHVLYQSTVLMAHVVILTNKEVIIIQEDERSRETRGVRYGGKWRYIALQHIRSVLLMDHVDHLISLALTLSPVDRQVKILFAAERKQEIIEFQAELEKLIGLEGSG